MSVIRVLIATRRYHRYASTRLGRKFLAFHLFKRIVRRHMADLEAHDKSAFSNNFKETLPKVASIKALKKIYPLVENPYGLRYLDFVYWQIAECRQDPPILEIAWNEPRLFEEICCLPNSCVILILHNGFTHGARALSYSKKRLAAVNRLPDPIGFYKRNKVSHPEDIEIVPVNSETLLTLTEVAKRNKAIICAPDAPNPKTGQYDLLSIGMFHFARHINLPLYFFDFYMDEDCVLRGFIKGPIDFGLGAVKAAEDFIRFCQSISGRNLTLIKAR